MSRPGGELLCSLVPCLVVGDGELSDGVDGRPPDVLVGKVDDLPHRLESRLEEGVEGGTSVSRKLSEGADGLLLLLHEGVLHRDGLDLFQRAVVILILVLLVFARSINRKNVSISKGLFF